MAQEHINFFSDLEKNSGLAERKAEAAREQHATLKKIGALVYLGQSVHDAKSEPWYQRAPHGPEISEPVTNPRQRRGKMRRQQDDDPLAAMQGHLKHKSRVQERQRHLQSEASAMRHPTQEDHRRARLDREAGARQQVRVACLVNLPAAHACSAPLLNPSLAPCSYTLVPRPTLPERTNE